MRWVKAHATCENILRGDVSVLDLFGNACADALAGRARKQADVFPQDAVIFCGVLILPRRSRRGLSPSLSALLLRTRVSSTLGVGKKVRKMAAITVGGLAVSSKHSLVRLSSSWHCSECLEDRHCDPPVLTEWFATDCAPFLGSAFARRVGLSRPCISA